MARFLVSLTRAVYEYTEVEVEADTQDGAEKQALLLAANGAINDWEPAGTGADSAVVVGSDAVPA